MEHNKQNYAEAAESHKRGAEPAGPRGMLCKTSRTASSVKQNQQDRANVEQNKQNYAEPAEPRKRGPGAVEPRRTLCKTSRTASNVRQNQQDRANAKKKRQNHSEPAKTNTKNSWACGCRGQNQGRTTQTAPGPFARFILVPIFTINFFGREGRSNKKWGRRVPSVSCSCCPQRTFASRAKQSRPSAKELLKFCRVLA